MRANASKKGPLLLKRHKDFDNPTCCILQSKGLGSEFVKKNAKNMHQSDQSSYCNKWRLGSTRIERSWIHHCLCKMKSNLHFVHVYPRWPSIEVWRSSYTSCCFASILLTKSCASRFLGQIRFGLKTQFFGRKRSCISLVGTVPISTWESSTKAKTQICFRSL